MIATDRSLKLLQLLQFADSALPVGGAAHSYGLEALVTDGSLAVADLAAFLREYAEESGVFEAYCCRAAHALASVDPDEQFLRAWAALNLHYAARKPAREVRLANALTGRRFLQLAVDLTDHQLLCLALQRSQHSGGEAHYCPAFGLVAGLLTLDAEATVLAFLHQSLAGLISACQRLLPLGQGAAARLLWELKPLLVATTQLSATFRTADEIPLFTPLLDIAAMRHPLVEPRLFMS